VPLPPDVPADAATEPPDVVGPVVVVAGPPSPDAADAAEAAAGSLAVGASPPDGESPAEGASPPVEAGVFERLASRASFLAQPDPLNTMAGTESARFIAPPHRSQVVGPGAAIECITSTTWPHDSHT